LAQIIGALWCKHKEDMEYYSGNIKAPFDMKAGQRINIAVFFNNRKKEENQQDYNIVLSIPRKQK